MSTTFKILLSSLLVLCTLSAQSQTTALEKKAWASYLDLDQYLKPFWKSDVIYDESIQLIKDGDKIAANLLFGAKKVLSVKDATLQKEYKEGVDWKYEQGKIVFNEAAGAPFFLKNELVFTEKKAGLSMEGKQAGQYVIWTENGLFQSKQLLVTYVKDSKSKWSGPTPVFSKNILPNTIAKLQAKKPFRLVFFGNSIEAGANSSGPLNKAPFVPTWADMITYGLQKAYKKEIVSLNKSVGGMMAKWGVENCEKVVAAEHPDLVIIGFGMNDGTFRVPPATFISQINAMVDKISAENKHCEFIIISTMLANPDATQNQLQEDYRPEILALQKKGIAVVDITGVHQELLKHKSYQDMTGNNVNHPNDYLARWYAQVILGMLTPKK